MDSLDDTRELSASSRMRRQRRRVGVLAPTATVSVVAAIAVGGGLAQASTHEPRPLTRPGAAEPANPTHPSTARLVAGSSRVAASLAQCLAPELDINPALGKQWRVLAAAGATVLSPAVPIDHPADGSPGPAIAEPAHPTDGTYLVAVDNRSGTVLHCATVQDQNGLKTQGAVFAPTPLTNDSLPYRVTTQYTIPVDASHWLTSGLVAAGTSAADVDGTAAVVSDGAFVAITNGDPAHAQITAYDATGSPVEHHAGLASVVDHACWKIGGSTVMPAYGSAAPTRDSRCGNAFHWGTATGKDQP